ncbi:MAG: response regulator [Desulfobacteraceae bacterium]|nr:response regulator [Desulfobacteraceae bacterium]
MSEKLRILIVDDDQSMAKTLKDIFAVKGHEAEMVHSGPEALEKISEADFDCILTDIKMPEMNGVELYRAIKGEQPDISVVLMTAYSADKLVKEGLEQGAIAALTKPLDIEALLDFFSILRKERSVVIVDDDPRFCKTLGDILEGRGFEVTQIPDPHHVIERLEANAQVVLLDMKLNGISGLDLLKEIREGYPNMPVILVTGYREEMGSMVEEALEINAYTCLYKPLQIDELIEILREVSQQELGRVLGQSVRKKG